MFRGQTLRALVNERLTAAAEEIFMLFERTIIEYEEELCRSKEENQRKQRLLDKVMTPSTSPGAGQNQEITETPQIKVEPNEQSVKREEAQLTVPVTESSSVCVKPEESSLIQQRQMEQQKETQEEDISSEPHFYSRTVGPTEHSSDTDNNEDWQPFSCSAIQMETEADGNHYNQVQIGDKSTNLPLQSKFAPETTVHSEHMSGAHGGGAERKKHQCPFCNKGFTSKGNLENHIRVHTGEKPYSCSVCKKQFTQKCHLDAHKRTHTGEKPYSCSSCGKQFTQNFAFRRHKRTHTGEKPYSCSICEKHFADYSTLRQHERTHTGERPFSCSICDKTFTHKSNLNVHTRKHKC